MRSIYLKNLHHAAQLNEAQRRAAQARWRAERTARRSPNEQPPAAPASAEQPPAATADAAAATPPPDKARAVRSAERAQRRPPASRADHRLSYSDWLHERATRTPAPPDRRVHLIDANGKRVASTHQSNAHKATAALQPQHGPLTVIDA